MTDCDVIVLLNTKSFFDSSIWESAKVAGEGGTIGSTIGSAIEDLTDRQKEVLNLIKGDNKLSVRKLAEKLDINVSAAQGHFEILKEKGVIERIGGTRGYWKIIIEL